MGGVSIDAYGAVNASFGNAVASVSAGVEQYYPLIAKVVAEWNQSVDLNEYSRLSVSTTLTARAEFSGHQTVAYYAIKVAPFAAAFYNLGNAIMQGANLPVFSPTPNPYMI